MSCSEVPISIMFQILALVLVTASFAVAEVYTASKNVHVKVDETSINEYIREFLKLTGQGQNHANEATGKVVPEHIKIRLYSSPEDVLEETLNNYANILKHPQFNRSLETKIYVHGWLEKEDHKLHKMLPTLYALRGKMVNWITVDWSEYSHSNDFNYVRQQIVPKIAEYLVPMIEKLMETQQNNGVHLIGFDMGAHLAGLVGKHIHGRKIARITGLSPAGRFYNDVPQEERLAKGDAEYVDVIHTNWGGAGIAKTVGDVDFLPNGGRHQPAVENKNDLTQTGKDIVCHMLAQNYFVESVELGYGGFIGKKCESWTNFLKQKCVTHETEVMGEAISQKVNGTVYLTVNKVMKPFYSQGVYGIYPYIKSTTHSYDAMPVHE